MNSIHLAKHFFNQLYHDLIGKDSHRGITLTYAWLANQMGHFSLGFIPTCLLSETFIFKNSTFWFTLIVGGFWLVFELFNVLWSILATKKRTLYFKPKWGNIIFDTATDLAFFWLGGLSYLLFSLPPNNLSYAVLLIGLYLIVVTPIWFMIKLFQQNALYPFQFRLSQWQLPIHKQHVKEVSKFVDSTQIGDHFLIYGKKGSGKTSLAVGIANECSIKRKRSAYYTMIKLIPLLKENEEKCIASCRSIWTWRNADILVIDDINIGGPLQRELISAQDLKTFLLDNEYAEMNKHAISSKTVCWVLGDGDVASNQRHAVEWKDMLNEFGVSSDRIKLIDLDTID